MTYEQAEQLGREWAGRRGIVLANDEDDYEDDYFSFVNLPFGLDIDVPCKDENGHEYESCPEDSHDSESDAYAVLGFAIHYMRELVK